MTEDEMKDENLREWQSWDEQTRADFHYAQQTAEAFSTKAEYWFMKGWVARGA